ncbi:hypothetical protein [Natrinema salifodinae]|uniref:Uncharacterized protein n=1 Tax=Natrinema salifodinae TaxID=1202768 RepID=A0A1I0NH88_9EURY|nr:hypothetical protein [Natrinema salifodinae]SEW00461.1 hypothetical protein SAMN05216285_1704 [Natrinema salifodinae]
MRASRPAIVALLCLVSLVSLVGLAGIAVVAGAPPPIQLCGSCASDVPGATGPGTLDVYVDADGDSMWVERVPVTESAADRYRENAISLERTVREQRSPRRVVGDDADRTVVLEDGTVTVTYTVDDVARPGVRDAWLFDYFANARYRLAGERVTVHAPEDTVVTNAPRDASVDGNAVTWTTDGGFGSRTYVTYGPSDSPLVGTASGYATIGLEVGPAALDRGVTGGIVPAALLAVAGLAVGRVDRGRDAFDLPDLERLLAAVGAIGAVGLVVASTAATGRPLDPGFGALSALGIGYAGLSIAARRSASRRGVRGAIGLAVLATLGTGVLLWLLGGLSSLVVLPFGLAAALFLPLGCAAERGSNPLVAPLLTALASTALLVGAVALAALLSPSGLGIPVYWVLIAWWAVTVAAFGYPLALLGRRLAAERKN